MPVKPRESEAEYCARLEVERRTHALAAQESGAAEEERQRLLAVERHRCPKCGAPLVTLHHRGVESEQCAPCQGVWLDRRELEYVLAGAPAQGFFGSLKRLWESGEGKRPCPGWCRAGYTSLRTCGAHSTGMRVGPHVS